jgi:hypothetical protein
VFSGCFLGALHCIVSSEVVAAPKITRIVALAAQGAQSSCPTGNNSDVQAYLLQLQQLHHLALAVFCFLGATCLNSSCSQSHYAIAFQIVFCFLGALQCVHQP